MNKSRIIFTVDIEHDQPVGTYNSEDTYSPIQRGVYSFNIMEQMRENFKLPFHFTIKPPRIDITANQDAEENFKDLDKGVLNHGIERLEDLLNSSIYGCDLHGELFNSIEFEIYYYRAEHWLREYGVFEAISDVIEYEEQNFGEINTQIGNSCKLLNMLVYIKGEELLQENESVKKILDKYWNKYMPQAKLKKILKLLKAEL